MITSRQNPKLRLVRALNGRSKERREAGAFIAEGVRLVEEAAAVEWPIRYVLFSDGLGKRGKELIGALTAKDIDVEQVSGDLLQSLTDTESTQGVIAVLHESRFPIPATPNFVLIIDQIHDPGNLGTLLRSAYAAGVQAILLPPGTTDAFAPKVVRAGMGAHFHLPIHPLSWEEIRQAIKSANLEVFLAEMKARSCWESDLREPLALIIGSEAEGPSEQGHKLANRKIGIPMSGQAESLNAAVAGSILLFEVTRQRLFG